MVYTLRFYGSCGHVTNHEITEDGFLKWSKENDLITKEEDNTIVHVYPFRFCICVNCMKEVNT